MRTVEHCSWLAGGEGLQWGTKPGRWAGHVETYTVITKICIKERRLDILSTKILHMLNI